MPSCAVVIGTSLSFALTAASLPTFAPAPAGDKKAVVRDAWGEEVTVHGYDDEKLDEKWFVHDPERPQPPRAEAAKIRPNLNAQPPEGAIILFDGSDLEAWKGGAWAIGDGFMEVRRGGIETVEHFGSCRLHIEWASPKDVRGEGQGRGNSGVFFFGRYEIQVLDSWKNATYADGMAASLYGQRPPDFNAAVEPGEWNSYDIEFRAPQFDDQGKVTQPARVTVVWNGVKVHDNVELIGATSHRRKARYSPHGPKGPISLQDHGDPVRFRNIWVVEMAE